MLHAHPPRAGDRNGAPRRRGPTLLSALTILGLIATTLWLAPPLQTAANAAVPTCQSADSDPDGDGWGWENNASCTVAFAGDTCDYSQAHLHGGWGWDDTYGVSCPPKDGDTPSEPAPTPTEAQDSCDYSQAHLHGGWGWDNENRASCPPLDNDEPASTGSAPEQVTVLNERVHDSGRLAITSETTSGELRVVTVHPSGQIDVVQVREDSGSSNGFRPTPQLSDREARNVNLPGTLAEARSSSQWRELPYSQSVFHQDDNVPGPEIKFIHADGREAVYYNHGPLATDPHIAGTYNYANVVGELSEGTGLLERIQFAIANREHFFRDILPWLFERYVLGQNADPNGPIVPDEGDLDNRDDDDDGVPARWDLDDKDPNRGARPGTPAALDALDDDDDGIPASQDLDDKDPNRGARPGSPLADDDRDGVINRNDHYPADGSRHDSNDRDGDGVPNAQDDFPDDSARSEESDSSSSHDPRTTNNPLGTNTACDSCP